MIARTTSTEICWHPVSGPLRGVDDSSLALVGRLDNSPVVATGRRVERIPTDLLPISGDSKLSIIAILHLHVEGRTSKTVSGTATPVIASATTSARHGVQCCGAATTPIRFKPINLQTVGLVVLTIVTVMITAKSSTNTVGRHCVDVWDYTCVRTGHIKIELHIATKQVECCLCGSSTISLDAPTSIFDLHPISVGHNKVAGVWAVQICSHSSEDVRHKRCLHHDECAKGRRL